jgi:catechol 2,3-dioxygenase-like lactoylglutathione lyase family enzyme
MESLFEPLGIDHVVLHVRDQAASQRFYTDLLGCTLDHVNPKFSLIQLRFGQALIDLLPLDPRAGAPSPETGMDHLCLSIRSEDPEKVARELRARGVTVEGEVVKRRGAFGEGPSIYIRDPDGYRIELKPR